MRPVVNARRCMVPEQDLVPGLLELDPAEANHLTRVRRAGPGDEVVVLNGRGQRAVATVEETDKRQCVLRITGVETIPPVSPHVTLVVGGLKQSAWEECLRHAVELQVNRIFRVQTEHAVADISDQKRDKKIHRWTESLAQACKQSGCPWMPELRVLGSVSEALGACREEDALWVASLEGTPDSFGEMMKAGLPDRLSIWVGPEGDFSSDEINTILTAPASRAVSLGSAVLRSETAALAMLSRIRLDR